MTQATSLALLQGAKAKISEALPENPVPAEEEEKTVVSVDKMSAKAIQDLVEEHQIETPDTWKTMKVQEKRDWLNEQYGDEGTEAEDQAETAATPVEETADETQPQYTPDAEVPIAAQPTKAVVKKAKASVGVAETPGEDPLADLIHEIENMDEKTAIAEVMKLTEETEMTLFKLGGILSVIQSNHWFEPYETFKEFVETKLGMHYRKATYWTAIYNSLVEAQIPWSKVQGVTWTKLKEIAQILTQENVDKWVQLAKEQTVLQLIETVKAAKQQGVKEIGNESANQVTTKTFKVHSDQKANIEAALDKAKADSGTTVDTAALEFICLDYLGGQKMSDRLKAMGLTAALASFEQAFPEASLSLELPGEQEQAA